MKKLTLLFAWFLVVFSCELIPAGYKYNRGTFPENPVNMGDINSEYDDYNSDTPVLGNTAPLCFSSKRNSQGDNYDIVYKLLSVYMDRDNGKLTVAENKSTNLDVYSVNKNIKEALNLINTDGDEMGPYLIDMGSGYTDDSEDYRAYQKYIFLYASNETGNFEIRLTDNLTNYTYSSPVNVSFLNSGQNDMYPSIDMFNTKIYFCSDRSGSFDIFHVELSNPHNPLLNQLQDSLSKDVIQDSILSSDYNDKCPFIFYDNFIVFASDRPGGFGGFDLYYSKWKDGKWTPPVNFGNKINTEFDEYRPIVRPFGDFTNDFMIFSSNRSGGKGGFDLYYVGIEKIDSPVNFD